MLKLALEGRNTFLETDLVFPYLRDSFGEKYFLYYNLFEWVALFCHLSFFEYWRLSMYFVVCSTLKEICKKSASVIGLRLKLVCNDSGHFFACLNFWSK